MCEEGATTPLIWTPLSTLHPCTWSFFLLIDEADELSLSQDCRFWSFWVRYGSTKDQEEGGRWCTFCTMCLSTWMGVRSPGNRRQKGFALWDQQVGGAGWHESAHRLEKKKKKKSVADTLTLWIYFITFIIQALVFLPLPCFFLLHA